jgi:hypothetical protein
MGATGNDIWKLGENIYTPNTAGDALRYMYDPALGGDYDWYPTRYTGNARTVEVSTPTAELRILRSICSSWEGSTLVTGPPM